jgi:hypothetical protein
MDQARSVTASFQQEFELVVNGAGNGSGTVTGQGLNCTITAGSTSGTCSLFYTAGTNVTLNAAASGSDTFAGWSGDCTGTGSCTVTLSQPRSVTAQFDAPGSFSLSVSGSGDGDGVVTSSPAGINCTITDGSAAGGTCSTTFAQGTQVSLSATPTSSPGQQSTFTGWSGDCTGSSCTVTAGTGSGTVSGQGISCTISSGSTSGTCSLFYTAGTSVTLIQNPSGSDTFGGWSGDCTGTGSCTVTMDQPRSVTAQFDAPPGFSLTVTGGGTGDGTVKSNWPGIDCTINGTSTSGACQSTFVQGRFLQLWPAPTGTDFLASWSSPCPSIAAEGEICEFNINQDETVTAVFQPISPSAPMISNPQHQFILPYGQCGIPSYNRIQYTVDYSDSDGDVNSSTVRVRVKLRFNNGGSSDRWDAYVSTSANNTTTGDGFSGTVTADNCIIFGSWSQVDVTLTVVDQAGNPGDAVTWTIPKPAGAASVGPRELPTLSEPRGGGAGPPDPR